MKLLAAVIVLMAVQLAACASHRDMSRETALAIVKLAKTQNGNAVGSRLKH